VKVLDVDYDSLFWIREEYVKKEEPKLMFCMDEFWARGMSTKIAQVMHTTRQNIDRYVSLGRIKESRTMDKAIFELLGEDI